MITINDKRYMIKPKKRPHRGSTVAGPCFNFLFCSDRAWAVACCRAILLFFVALCKKEKENHERHSTRSQRRVSDRVCVAPCRRVVMSRYTYCPSVHRVPCTRTTHNAHNAHAQYRHKRICSASHPLSRSALDSFGIAYYY